MVRMEGVVYNIIVKVLYYEDWKFIWKNVVIKLKESCLWVNE